MKNKKIYILFSILIAIFCFTIITKTLPNDTYSAIKIGDYILHHGVDFVEHFNFNDLTYHNARWLFNVIIAFIYNNFSFLGVYLFVVINSIVLGLIMFNSLLKRNKNILFSFIITLVSLEFSANFLVARAQTISYILLFLEVIFLERMLETNDKRWIIGLLISSVLLANIHTTVWLMSLILFLPYFMEYFLSKIIKSKVLYSSTNNFKLLFISFLIIACSGLLTPLGLLPYTYMFKTLTGFSTVFILELQRANIFRDFVLLLLIIVYGLLFILRRKIKISDIFMVLGLFTMSLLAVRNIPFLTIIGSICLSRLIYDTLESFNIKIDNITDYIYKNKIIICLITIFAIVISSIFLYMHLYNNDYVDKTEYPIKAANYIIKNVDLDKIRLFNSFNNGSYLEFRGIKVFLDSRSEVYCKEFNDTSILEDWYNATYISQKYKPIFDKYNFTHVLVKRSEPLNVFISQDEDYKKIYEDEYYVLFEKVE